jgi:hypothetical protein
MLLEMMMTMMMMMMNGVGRTWWWGRRAKQGHCLAAKSLAVRRPRAGRFFFCFYGYPEL